MSSPQPKIPREVQDRIDDGAIGPYKIVSMIGAGGMGAVFRCRDAKLKRDVAVKLLLAPSDGTNIERFLSEARTMARLSHPNVVQVYDVGYDGHVPYFVMELVEGESLAQKLDRLGRLPVDEIRELLVQIASGLAAVHRLGIIHRDVKAANVIETTDGVAKILDFGIARPVEKPPQLTSTGLVMDTPSSMAPEQLRGEDLDARADVYALGVLGYQLLTGQRPYEGDDPSELARKHDEAPYTKIRTLRADVPEDLERVVDRALAKKRDERYWNCEEILHELAPGITRAGTLAASHVAHVAQGTPLAPAAPDSPAPTRERLRPRPAAIGFVACVIALVALVGARRAAQGCVFVCDSVPAAEGKPAIDAATSGVFLWHDGFGWHLRAKSADRARELSGVVRVTGGVLEAARAIDGASADALTLDERHEARFHFDDPAALAGFDFQARTGCVELTVTSQNEAVPALVHVGAGGSVPTALPIRFCR